MSEEVAMGTGDELLYRLSSVEERLQGLQDEVETIRRLVPKRAPVAEAPRVEPPTIFSPEAPPPREAFPTPTPPPASAPPPPAEPPPPPAPPRDPFDFGVLFGPKALAWA